MRPWPRLNVHQQRRVFRLRRIGDALLAISVGLAIVVYRLGEASRQPTVQDLLPATASALERQRGILFGRTGVAMFRWFEALQEPLGQAGIVVAIGVVATLTCYHFAHVIEVEEG